MLESSSLHVNSPLLADKKDDADGNHAMAKKNQNFIPSGCKNSLPTSPYCENMFLIFAGFMNGGIRLI